MSRAPSSLPSNSINLHHGHTSDDYVAISSSKCKSTYMKYAELKFLVHFLLNSTYWKGGEPKDVFQEWPVRNLKIGSTKRKGNFEAVIDENQIVIILIIEYDKK